MSFLGKLASQINSQMSVGENTNHSLDAVIDGQNQQYGSLGDFAKKFDQSSERRYVEEGYLRKDPFNTTPKQFEVLLQEPNATVLFKKRMFSSVNENYRPDFMDADEKLYYKAMKILFQNKCRQISALEKLSKIQKITESVGNVSDQLMPLIFSLTDDAGSGFSVGGPDLFGGINSNGAIGDFTKVIDRLRRVYAFNTPNKLTTWITDPTNLFQSQFGQGTGVIEITNFTSLTTTVGLDIKSPGSFSMNIVDPYESMLITEYDIERALSDATNSFYNHKIFQFGQDSADQIIANTTNRLNQLRTLRKVSAISFKINPDTLLGRRVVAVLDRNGTELPFVYNGGFGGLGGGVDVSDEYLKGGEVAGIDGLDTERKGNLGPDSNIKALFPESELSVFERLVTAIFSKIQLEANSRGAFVMTNKLTNYARRKLRFNFSGKLIIQPMDTVHIYMNSKSRFDNKLLSGLNNTFSGGGILQNLNKTITDLKNSFDTVFNPGGSVNLQVEKASFVGPDFPNFLWSLIRNQFVIEKEGTHVFAGIVQGATDTWSDGKFTVSVKGSDNSAYFEMGKINFKPGVDVFNGSLYDPLTPFKTKFDTVSSGKDDSPVLLNENQWLLGTSQDRNAPLVKFKLGPNAGKAAYTDNVFQDVFIEKATRSLSKVFYAPDGLVYKWKEGIGTLVQFGSSEEINDPNKVGNPAITKDPFAGQDIMNVLSLLITGTPYNFANYWKAVSNFDGFNRDPQSQQDASYSYYDSLKNDLAKSNNIWGNFIPFKTLSIDEQSFSKMMNSQFSIIRINKDLEAKLKKKAEVQQAADMFAYAKANALVDKDKYDGDYQKAQAESDKLTKETNKLIKLLQKTDQSTNALVQFGGDTSYDFNEYLNGGNPNKQLSDSATRRLLRRQVNYLTRRMSYNVRGNEDKNLFIVDDFYDKDYDIAAFETSLADGIKLFNNEFISVKDKITAAADLLNLEVFADTQGHIRVRPPQYNRMPGSVFYRMMFLKKSTGLQVFPQFLDDLFGDQIKSLTQRVEILEDQIRLDCAVLGIGSKADGTPDPDFIFDGKATAFISGSGASAGKGEPFAFLSNTEGNISDLLTTMDAANPDVKEASAEAKLKFTELKTQATTARSIFPNTERYRAVLDSLSDSKLALAGYHIQDELAYANNKRVDDLIHRIKDKSGQQISRTSFLITADILSNGPPVSAGRAIDVFKVTQELAERISDRQKALKLLYSVTKNAIEARSLDDDSSTGSRLLTPGVYGNSHVPELFEHMIEDETYDDYGPGSGSRYVIKRAQIRSLNITETPPDFTIIEVQGRIDPSIVNTSLPGDLNVFPGGGNGLVTAAALDYDMWRNYGFRQQSVINLPFFSDPVTQCAPYASMMLSRARRNILQGSLTISGNEFMQPGEVIFLEDRGMLFYVTSVQHSFTFGTGFTTTLDLRYGHTPGEYIPVPLDVVGKMLYNNRDTSGFIVQRQSNATNDKNIGIVLRDPKTKNVFDRGDKKDAISSFSAANTQTINNILFSVAHLINSNNTKGNTIKASVELRVYKDANNPVDADLDAFAQEVQQSLTVVGKGPKQNFNKNTPAESPNLKPKDVKVVPIDLSALNNMNSPSQKAIDAARNYTKIASMSGKGAGLPGSPSTSGFGAAFAGIGSAVANSFSAKDNQDGGKGTKSGEDADAAAKNIKEREQLRSVLYKYIIDIWVKFEQVSVEVAQAQVDGSEIDE